MNEYEQERQRKAAEAQKIQDERKRAAWNGLKQAVEATGHSATVTEKPYATGSTYFDLAMPDLNVRVELTREPSGRLRFKVGGYGRDANQFPEPKAGFDFGRIAAAILAHAKQSEDAIKRVRERDGRLAVNKPIAESINRDLGFQEYYGPRATTDSGTGQMLVKMDLVANEEEARAILTAVRAVLDRRSQAVTG